MIRFTAMITDTEEIVRCFHNISYQLFNHIYIISFKGLGGRNQAPGRAPFQNRQVQKYFINILQIFICSTTFSSNMHKHFFPSFLLPLSAKLFVANE